ncbi:hypothetical protein BGX38DRAFT_1181566, partial [Terfezia claveryi]
MTQEVNDELNDLCAGYPRRLYASGAVPLSGSVAEPIQEIKRMACQNMGEHHEGWDL